MRRTIPYAVAVVATTVALLAVMVGQGLGVTSGQAGPPTQVFMQTTEGDEVCLTVTGENAGAMQQDLTLTAGSDLMVQFTYEMEPLRPSEQADLAFNYGGGEPNQVFESAIWRTDGPRGRQADTLTWSFRDVPTTGEYSVIVFAVILPHLPVGHFNPSVALSGCSLTVFVSAPES